MSRLKLLILDANVVILLHEFGIWEKFIEACEVHLAQTVLDEAHFYEVDGERRPIDLADDLANKRVTAFQVNLAGIKAFRDQFDPVYLAGLDAGECESLAFLCLSSERYLISSGDAIVYKVLGCLNRQDSGISLEELLQKIGLQRNQLSWPCRKAFREKYTSVGVMDAFQGKGLKKKK